MNKGDLVEVAELENEITEFLVKMEAAENEQEYEMYRQMIKINICCLKNILER